MTPHRVVLDANVIVSALIRPDSAPGRILRAAVESRAVLMVTSAPLLNELLMVLNYPRLQRYLKMSAQDRQAFVVLLEQIAEPVNLADHPETGACRDPADEPYLQTAVAGRADCIISGDRDLLDMQEIDGIPIVMPADFDRILQARGRGDFSRGPRK